MYTRPEGRGKGEPNNSFIKKVGEIPNITKTYKSKIFFPPEERVGSDNTYTS